MAVLLMAELSAFGVEQEKRFAAEIALGGTVYQCMAIKKYAMSGSRGERCKIKTGLDEKGFCDAHRGRDDPKWICPGPPPEYRPPPSAEAVAAQEASKKKYRDKKAAAADGIRERVQDALPDSCEGATNSKLFDALAARLLKAPSKARVKDITALAEAVERCWLAVEEAGLLEASPIPPLVNIDRSQASPAIFYDALYRPPLVARMRATDTTRWEDVFVKMCLEALPAAVKPVKACAYAAFPTKAFSSFMKQYPELEEPKSTPEADTYVSHWRFASLDSQELMEKLTQPRPNADAAAAAAADAQTRLTTVQASLQSAVPEFLLLHERALEYRSLSWITDKAEHEKVTKDTLLLGLMEVLTESPRGGGEELARMLKAKEYNALMEKHNHVLWVKYF
jgi:hypothetical protein